MPTPMLALPISALAPDLTKAPNVLDTSLDLRFDLGEIDSRITTTRASTRTRQGPIGYLDQVAANVLAIDYDPATKHDSVTALTVSVGVKTLAVTGGSGFANGTPVRITSKADQTKWMAGVVLRYASGSLRVAVLRSGGSGSASDWAVLECLGASIWEQRTNLLTYSEQFDNAAWTKSEVSTTPNTAVAPDGTLTADHLADSTVNNTHLLQQSPSYTSGTAYAMSVFAKAGARSFVQLRVTTGATSFSAIFNLATGAVTGLAANTTATATLVGNGWYRVSIVFTSVNTGAGASRIAVCQDSATQQYVGDGVSGIYIWGAQLEAGAFPTPYIPCKATFTSRASTATYFDAAGVLRTAAINEARNGYGLVSGQWVSKGLELEGAATNLFINSEIFTGSTGTTATSNTIAAPDGLLTADLMIEDTSTGEHYVNDRSFTPAAGTTYVFSTHVKQGPGSRHLYLRVAAGNVAAIRFDPTTGAITTTGAQYVSSGATQLASGFWRVWMTWRADSATNTVCRHQLITSGAVTSYQGDGTSGLYIWGAQLETGSYPTSYIPTIPTFTSRASTATYFDQNGVLQTAGVNVARNGYGYVNGAWVSKGLELEAAATNLLLRSAEFDNATAWSTSNASVTANAINAPDATLSADHLVEDAGTGWKRSTQTISVTSGTTYTFSLRAKAGARRYLQIGLQGAQFGGASSADTSAVFDLQTGAVASTGPVLGAGAKITPLGDGFYLCTVTLVATQTAASGVLLTLRDAASLSYSGYQGNGTSGLYIWGAQLETGPIATSYIPTTTAAVTRAADVSSSSAVTRSADVSSSSSVTRAADVVAMTGSNFSSWYNQSEGSFSVTARSFSNTESNGVVSADDGTSNNRLQLRYQFSGQRAALIGVRAGTNDLVASTSNGSWPVGVFASMALAYKLNDCAISIGGATAATDVTANPCVPTQLQLGQSPGQTATNGHIRRLRYHTVRRSNTHLPLLSA